MDTSVGILFVVASGLVLLLLVVLLVVVSRSRSGAEPGVWDRLIEQQQAQQRAEVETLHQLAARLEQQSQSSASQVAAQLAQFEHRLATMEQSNEQRMSELRRTMERQLLQIQRSNEEKLQAMNDTVNRRLQSSLDEKMKQVSDQLQQVYKGLGEMQTLAAGVGDLKKVLSNVKTRGILGEIQLGAILQEILAPEQYETNVAVVPHSRERVEFAVKFPQEDGSFLYLPIDSKFPGDTYFHLQEAYESGSAEAVQLAAKALGERLRLCAKEIHDKYIEPPYTTNFGILFLPFEGLYAEAVNRGLVEELQRKYRINIAGPSTMAALLNSLQMGFQTLAIQKRSHEVWEVLGAVKTEFEKYRKVLTKAQDHLRQASNDLDALIVTRTNAMNRKLRSMELPDTNERDAARLLELEDD